jgi:hypothetical protein
LHINARKSFIYFGGVGDNLKQHILQDSCFSEGSFPFKHLEVPFSPHRLLASQFSPLPAPTWICYSRLDGQSLILCWAVGINQISLIWNGAILAQYISHARYCYQSNYLYL